MSGIATVVACTVSHRAWAPGDEVPYAIVIVENDLTWLYIDTESNLGQYL